MTASPAQTTKPAITTMTDFAAAGGTIAAQATVPLASHATVAGAECAALISKRATAWFDHGRKLGASRESNAWLAATQDFWRQAAADYGDCGQRIMSSWLNAAQGLTLITTNAGSTLPAMVTRDIITIKDVVPVETPAKTNGSRRAA